MTHVLAGRRACAAPGLPGAGWLVIADGRIVDAARGLRRAGAVDRRAGVARARVRRHPGQRRGRRRLRLAPIADGWRRAVDAQLAEGVTSYCPTLVSAPLDAYPPTLERVLAARADAEARRSDSSACTSRDRSSAARPARIPSLSSAPPTANGCALCSTRSPASCARDARARSRSRTSRRRASWASTASSSRSATAPRLRDGARGGRRRRAARHASLQRHGPAAPPRAGSRRRRPRRRAADALPDRRLRARAPGRAAPRHPPQTRRGARDRPGRDHGPARHRGRGRSPRRRNPRRVDALDGARGAEHRRARRPCRARRGDGGDDPGRRARADRPRTASRPACAPISSRSTPARSCPRRVARGEPVVGPLAPG